MISLAHIPSPRVFDGNLAYAPLGWVAFDAANPRVEVRVVAINEWRARVAAGIELRVEAWRVRVRPAVPSLELA